MAPFTLDAWIGPLVADSDDERLILACPTSFHCERVRERFLAAIERCAREEAGAPVTVELVVRPPLPSEPPGEPWSDPDPEAALASARARAQGGGAAAAAPEAPAALRAEKTAIAPSAGARARATRRGSADDGHPGPQRELPYRFDNFVVGSCNALAREASLAVANGTQRALNPLLLASPSGLGKTHLARAIVAAARAQGESRAIYASAEAFTNEFTSSLRTKRADQFKRRYRQGCKLLVLEDVQFLDARKKATQLELFHTVSHLLDVGARVVLTADRLPRDLEGLDPRLRATFSQGLVAELEAPDAEVRRDILRQKAADGGVRLPDDCRELLVECVRGSVRDLEGALIQLVASASLLKQRDRSGAHARGAAQALAGARGRASARASRCVTCATPWPKFFKKHHPRRDGRRARGAATCSLPRQLAMYFCRRYSEEPLAGDRRRYFDRDHPSVSQRRASVIERRILERAPLRYQVEALCARLDAVVGERRR